MGVMAALEEDEAVPTGALLQADRTLQALTSGSREIKVCFCEILGADRRLVLCFDHDDLAPSTGRHFSLTGG